MAKQTAKKAKRGTQSRGRRAPKKAASKSTRAKTRTRTAARSRGASSSGIDAIAKRIVAVTTSHDDAGTLALYADNVESTEMGQPTTSGIDAIKQKFEMWRSMTTAASFTPRTVAVSGNTIVIEWKGMVTLAASGNTVEMNEVAVHEIAGGKIVRERYYYNPTSLQP